MSVVILLYICFFFLKAEYGIRYVFGGRGIGKVYRSRVGHCAAPGHLAVGRKRGVRIVAHRQGDGIGWEDEGLSNCCGPAGAKQRRVHSLSLCGELLNALVVEAESPR